MSRIFRISSRLAVQLFAIASSLTFILSTESFIQFNSSEWNIIGLNEVLRRINAFFFTINVISKFQ